MDVRYGTDLTTTAGERATVETGVRHTFRNEGTTRAVVVTTIHDPGRLKQVLPTLGGLAHDDLRDPDDPLQRAVIAKRLERNTVFTAGEGTASELATDALAPIARLAGYRGPMPGTCGIPSGNGRSNDPTCETERTVTDTATATPTHGHGKSVCCAVG